MRKKWCYFIERWNPRERATKDHVSPFTVPNTMLCSWNFKFSSISGFQFLKNFTVKGFSWPFVGAGKEKEKVHGGIVHCVYKLVYYTTSAYSMILHIRAIIFFCRASA